MEKRNVMKTGVLWHEVINALHQREFGDVKLEHQLADAGGMQLVRWPKQFDVIVTDNLFGDMLSDVAAMLTGSLGMLPSASLGETNPKTGKRKAMYEPVHGSAPDIAGKALANPIAMITSFGMALRYSFGMGAQADLIDRAIAAALAKGLRTADIKSEGAKLVSTSEMGAAIIGEMEAAAAWAAEPARASPNIVDCHRRARPGELDKKSIVQSSSTWPEQSPATTTKTSMQIKRIRAVCPVGAIPAATPSPWPEIVSRRVPGADQRSAHIAAGEVDRGGRRIAGRKRIIGEFPLARQDLGAGVEERALLHRHVRRRRRDRVPALLDGLLDGRRARRRLRACPGGHETATTVTRQRKRPSLFSNA